MCKIWTTYIQTYRDSSPQASHAISFTLHSLCVKYEPPTSKHVEIFYYKPAIQSASPYTVSVQNMNHNFIQTCRDISLQASHTISFTLYSQCAKYEPPTTKHVGLFHYKPAIQSASPYKSVCKIWTTYIQTCRDISLQASHTISFTLYSRYAKWTPFIKTCWNISLEASHTISFTLYSQCVKYEPPSSKHVELFHYKPAIQSASPYTVSVQSMNHLHTNM